MVSDTPQAGTQTSTGLHLDVNQGRVMGVAAASGRHVD
jgi:hypothetical protein